MDSKKHFSKLPNYEEKFFNGILNNETWVEKLYFKYNKPTSNGQNNNNNFYRENNQTVAQWRRLVNFKKITSLKRFKRLGKHKVYIQPLGPFPAQFRDDRRLCFDLQHSLKMFTELFFPGFIVDFLPIVEHNALNLKTRFHEKSKQLQLFLPGDTVLRI